MNDLHQRVWDAVDRRRQKHLGFLADLLRASEAGEEAGQACLAARARAAGGEVEMLRYDPRTLTTQGQFADDKMVSPQPRLAVAARRHGTGGGRSMQFWAHPDSVAVTDTTAWVHPPFAGQIDGGRMYGWGLADDLLGVALMEAGLEAVLDAGLSPRGDVILASTPSKGRARGIIAVLNAGYTADASIYLHPAESELGLHDIKSVASGQLRFRIVVPGLPYATTEPTHTVFYHLAVDPVQKAWGVHQALQELAARRAQSVHHPELDAAIGRSTNLQISCIQAGSERSLHLSPSECVLAGCLTFPPGEDMVVVQRQVEEAVRAAADTDVFLAQHRPSLEWLDGTNGFEVPAGHPLYQTVSRAIQAVCGFVPKVNPLHTASDVRNPILHSGIPCVGFGLYRGDSTQIGGHDEWIDVEDYVRAVKVIGSIIVDWCGV